MSIKTSVIMPAYRVDQFIGGAVRSVMSQTDDSWELIICDDGSEAESLAYFQQLAMHDDRVRILAHSQNTGPAKARNRGISAATGRYIAFLDSDDLWKPEKLERQIKFMQNKDLAFSYSSYDRIDEGGKFIDAHRVSRPVTYHDLLKSCVIGCLTAVYDTEKVGKVYMPERVGAEDFGLWLRILKKVDRAVPLPDSLAQYRVRTGSLSANKFTAAKYTWSIYRDEEKLGLLRSSYYFAHYAANGVLNTYVKPRLG